MNKAPDNNQPANDDLAPEKHVQFRKCAKCSDTNMAPVEQFQHTNFGGVAAGGLLYECAKCHNKVKIFNASTLVTGGFTALIAGFIGWWALKSGPIWYARHLPYFSIDDYASTMILLDVLELAFYSLVALFAAWMIWREFLVPITTWLRYPVTGQNRDKTTDETAQAMALRKSRLLGFFGFPFLVYIPLLAGIWLLDVIGVDIRHDEFFKFLGIFLVIGGAIYLAKRAKIEFTLIFFGMVFWMAVAVGLVFYLG